MSKVNISVSGWTTSTLSNLHCLLFLLHNTILILLLMHYFISLLLYRIIIVSTYYCITFFKRFRRHRTIRTKDINVSGIILYLCLKLINILFQCKNYLNKWIKFISNFFFVINKCFEQKQKCFERAYITSSWRETLLHFDI